MSLLERIALRDLARHPLQAGLAVAGVALGVAVVVSIDLANASAMRAFELSAASVTGGATHQVAGGPDGFDEALWPRLVLDLDLREAAPVVEGWVRRGERTLRLVGVDPLEDGAVRSTFAGARFDGAFTELLTNPRGVLLAAPTAAELGLAVGDAFAIDLGGRAAEVELVGTVRAGDAASRLGLADLLVADVATAQELLERVGRLDRIDLALPEGAAGAARRAEIEALLPAGVEVLEAGARSRAVGDMTRAFHVNLQAMSLLALLVGAFLIYNTTTFAVVRRRRLVGSLRAMGVTRREVLGLVLGEALWIGATGAVLGAGAGVALGEALVGLVVRTIDDLYFSLSIAELTVAPASLAKGLLLGVGATVLAAVPPAAEATGAPPSAALSRADLEVRARRGLVRATLAAVPCALLGLAVVSVSGDRLGLSYLGLFTLLVACALACPAATVLLLRLALPLARRAFGPLGGYAVRGLEASLSRTAVAVAALVIAVSATVGVGSMVASFRTTVVRWLEAGLREDVYVSTPHAVSQRAQTGLSAELVERVAAAEGVARVVRRRNAVIDGRGPDGAYRRVEVISLDALPDGWRSYSFAAGEPRAAWAALAGEGAMLVSEPFAWRHGLGVGDVLELRTDRGPRRFSVAGVFHDYASPAGHVLMARASWERWWDDRRVSALGLFAAEGVDPEALVHRLRGLVAPTERVVVGSSGALRDASLAIFDRTFAITDVLRLLATGVAFFGVLSALLALQLERTVELGVLRALGGTRRQVGAIVLAQTGLLGLVAGLLALPVGALLAWLLTEVINRRSFGWSLTELGIPLDVAARAVALAVGAALAAGLWPAWRMGRTEPAEALRAE